MVQGGIYQLLCHNPSPFLHPPLHRITCPSCVKRIAKKRTKERESAFGNGNGPRDIARYTRLVAEAYTRLAEIEENLKIQRYETDS